MLNHFHIFWIFLECVLYNRRTGSTMTRCTRYPPKATDLQAAHVVFEDIHRVKKIATQELYILLKQNKLQGQWIQSWREKGWDKIYPNTLSPRITYHLLVYSTPICYFTELVNPHWALLSHGRYSGRSNIQKMSVQSPLKSSFIHISHLFDVYYSIYYMIFFCMVLRVSFIK